MTLRRSEIPSWKSLALSLLTAVTSAAFVFSGQLQAQEDGYVDLLMLYEYDSQKVAYSVRNTGTATATGVTVSFLLKNLKAKDSDIAGNSITDERTEDTYNQSFTWEVGTIPPGGVSGKLVFGTSIHPGRVSEITSTWKGRVGVIRATASSLQPELAISKNDNVTQVYEFAYGNAASTKHMTGSELGLLLSVDNLRPDSGGNVAFSLTAQNLYPIQPNADVSINIIDGIEITVELSDGLEFESETDWTRPTKFETTSGRSATWTPEAVDAVIDHLTSAPRIRPAFRTVEIETQLTSDTLTDIPLEERCITARVTDSTPPPIPDYFWGTLTQCLGEDPPLLFEQGTLQAFTTYPCVNASGTAITSYPCGASDSTSEVAVIAVADSDDQNPDLRLQGVGRSSKGKVVLLPEQDIYVQVKDPLARVVSGSTVTWQTGRAQGVGTKTVPGVIVTYSLEDFVDETSGKECPNTTATCRWSNLLDEVKVKGLTQGSNPPGGVKVTVNADPVSQYDVHFDANSGNSYTSTRTTWDLGQYVSDSLTIYYLEFTTLGTHVIDFRAGVTRRSDSAVQEDTGTYTFHVGPIAELEVRDGGANPAVASGQRVYTIVVVNNGPDDAPAAKVTLSDLDADSCVGNATKGSVTYANGECAWTIGELIAKDASRIATGRDGEVLTIVTDANSEVTAAISNTQDYQVCIDSSGGDVDAASESVCTGTTGNTWHTTPYYDYISDNDSATIQAKDGTGADLPSLRGLQSSTLAIVVSWEPITDVNGRKVTHYEVQRETNPWETVAEKVTGTTYVDMNVAAGATHRYRVRAVNDRDQKGPWSQPVGGAATERVVTRTETVVQTETVVETETVVRTETVAVPVPYFAGDGTTRTVAENSAPGSPVGEPVTVVREPGNEVAYAYSLEGPDAALFTIEQDTGQILVGEGTLLDFEYGTASYTVEVVATDPSSGESVRTTVTIGEEDDGSETGFVFIDPAGAPQVGFPLFASLMHTEGNPIEPRWQWQRSMADGTWADIPGAVQDFYIPTELDAGRRLRALVVFGNPRGEGEGLAGAVTERVPGETQVIPTAGTGATPEEVFGVLAHNLAAVWLYDNATQSWAVYSPWNPPEVNDLKTVSSNDVVWMDIIGETQFQGKTLYPGWNLVVVN